MFQSLQENTSPEQGSASLEEHSESQGGGRPRTNSERLAGSLAVSTVKLLQTLFITIIIHIEYL